MSSDYIQTYSNSYQEVEFLDYSNSSYINALLNSSKAKPFKWKSDPKYENTFYSNTHKSTVITYSFPNSDSENSKYSYTDALGVELKITPLNKTQINDIKLAMQEVSNFLNVSFVEVQDNLTEVGTIRIAIKTITDSSGEYKESTSGLSNAPSHMTSGGDIFFNDWLINANFASGLITDSETSISAVSILYQELFYALGIGHPNNNPSIPFDEEKNSKEFTLMASNYSNNKANEYLLNQITKNLVTSSAMVYDIAALQYLYGSNNLYNSGDTIYSYNPKTPFIKTIWDGAGNDTIDLSNFNNEQLINLNDGSYSSIGFDVNWSMRNNLGIAFNTIIENAKGGSGKDTINGNKYNNNIQSNAGNDFINGGAGNDTIDGGSGSDTSIYSGKYEEYSFTREINSIKVDDKRIGTNDGTDTLSNIEYLQFTDQTVAASKIAESKVSDMKTYSGKFSDYKFYNKGNNVFQIKTNSGYEDITGYQLLTFEGEKTSSSFRNINIISDIKGTFDQITGLNTDDAKMFRLYNAAFKRLPDSEGLKYWIRKYTSGENDNRTIASSFLVSKEFKERYGDNVSNARYVETLYVNVLGRDYDKSGYNYWLGNLNAGNETRYELLLGFAESAENKTLFTEMTGWG